MLVTNKPVTSLSALNVYRTQAPVRFAAKNKPQTPKTPEDKPETRRARLLKKVDNALDKGYFRSALGAASIAAGATLIAFSNPFAGGLMIVLGGLWGQAGLSQAKEHKASQARQKELEELKLPFEKRLKDIQQEMERRMSQQAEKPKSSDEPGLDPKK